MPDNNDKKKPANPKPSPAPSTGEGADSALDALKKKRAEVPPVDPTLPLTPPRGPSSRD